VHLPQLKRTRWAVRATLLLGVAASIAANVLHARQNIISQLISAWPPLALLITVELTSRIPMHTKLLAACRVLSTAIIAGIAAWVSYWHMQDVAHRYGETGSASYLLPISVDGLIVVASVCLVELTGRIRMLEDEAQKAREARQAPAPAPVYRQVPAYQPAPAPRPVPARLPEPVSVLDDDDFTADDAMEDMSSAPVSPALGHGGARPAVSTPPRTIVTAATESNTPRQRRPVQETAELAAEIEAMHPGISPSEVARRLGISEVRLRAVRREAALARSGE
jgi:hypothetical protein